MVEKSTPTIEDVMKMLDTKRFKPKTTTNSMKKALATTRNLQSQISELKNLITKSPYAGKEPNELLTDAKNPDSTIL
jgi:Txe/YoeB family toxin of Txe-Axe toxin-antitoxin module